jgi:hypothetical protein
MPSVSVLVLFCRLNLAFGRHFLYLQIFFHSQRDKEVLDIIPRRFRNDTEFVGHCGFQDQLPMSAKAVLGQYFCQLVEGLVDQGSGCRGFKNRQPFC